MQAQDRVPSLWGKLPILLRAIVSGLLIALVAANIWPLLLLNLGAPLGAIAEAIFPGALSLVGERRRRPAFNTNRPRGGLP